MWGGKADAMCGQHHWPVWGRERIDTMIRQQRDLYKFAHDQTIRLMNHGLTATEIAETIRLPASLDGAWHARGYYGHIRHNVKAIYQKYLGWYDANPVNLDPLPPVGGRQRNMSNTWAAPTRSSRARRRISPEANSASSRKRQPSGVRRPRQSGRPRAARRYASSSSAMHAESATWRNAYLFGAQELRLGMPKASPRPPMPRKRSRHCAPGSSGTFSAVRLNGPKAEGKHIVLNWTFTDTNEALF